MEENSISAGWVFDAKYHCVRGVLRIVDYLASLFFRRMLGLDMDRHHLANG